MQNHTNYKIILLILHAEYTELTQQLLLHACIHYLIIIIKINFNVIIDFVLY